MQLANEEALRKQIETTVIKDGVFSEKNKKITYDNRFIELLNQRPILVSKKPLLSKLDKIILDEKADIIRILTQLEVRNETWIALKYRQKIFLIWNDLVFVFSSRT